MTQLLDVTVDGLPVSAGYGVKAAPGLANIQPTPWLTKADHTGVYRKQRAIPRNAYITGKDTSGRAWVYHNGELR